MCGLTACVGHEALHEMDMRHDMNHAFTRHNGSIHTSERTLIIISMVHKHRTGIQAKVMHAWIHYMLRTECNTCITDLKATMDL